MIFTPQCLLSSNVEPRQPGRREIIVVHGRRQQSILTLTTESTVWFLSRRASSKAKMAPLLVPLAGGDVQRRRYGAV
jgi:hypothetical protein